jgi:hypothetical protein
MFGRARHNKANRKLEPLFKFSIKKDEIDELKNRLGKIYEENQNNSYLDQNSKDQTTRSERMLPKKEIAVQELKLKLPSIKKLNFQRKVSTQQSSQKPIKKERKQKVKSNQKI